MPKKIFHVDEIGNVEVTKRRNTKRMTIRLQHTGGVAVTVPYWAPYTSAIAFVQSKKAWVLQHRIAPQELPDGMLIGKGHQLHYEYYDGTVLRGRVTKSMVKILQPKGLNRNSPEVIKKTQATAIRALKTQAEELLVPRVRQLAREHGFHVNSVSVKHLKARWGSCSSKNDITLNCFLMVLDWPQIDYVLYHELAHTEVHAHSTDFWSTVARYVPDYRRLRKELREQRPTLF